MEKEEEVREEGKKNKEFKQELHIHFDFLLLPNRP